MRDSYNKQYVVFELATEKFAFGIEAIQEVIRLQDITDIPDNANHMLGVINLRGKIVPVMNMHTCLGFSDMRDTRRSRIIVLHDREELVGVKVDSVNKVMRFSEIKQPSARMNLSGIPWIEGIGESGENLVAVLNSSKLFESDLSANES